MKGRHFFLTAMGMLCWVVWGMGAITTNYVDGDLVVWTDNAGASGYKGCDAANLTPVVAYVFELQRRNSRGTPTCSVGRSGRWQTVGTQSSDNGQTVFENIPEGHYRVVCRVGKAIGCEIVGAEEGYVGRSIVYEREVSGVVDLGVDGRGEAAMAAGDLEEDGLVVFPNPATKAITVLLKSGVMKSQVTISMVDMLGRTVYSTLESLKDRSADHTWKIGVGNFPAGAYVVMVWDEEGKVLQRKVVVMRS